MEPIQTDSESAQPMDSPGQNRSNAKSPLKIGAVAIIIAALYSMIFFVGGNHHNSTRALSKVTLKALAAILALYHDQTGTVPPNANSMITSASMMPSFKKAIAALPSGTLSTTASGGHIVLDGYGNPIVLVNARGNPRSPYFQSAGPDGILDTADDMFSYDP